MYPYNMSFSQISVLLLYFFQQFNFKIEIFPMFGHLCILSDQELEKFSFWS